MSLFPVLDYVNSELDLNLLRDICVFGMDIEKTLYSSKITLLNGMLCHVVFSNQEVWRNYHKRLMDKIKK